VFRAKIHRSWSPSRLPPPRAHEVFVVSPTR
jgi:hypothetical protein